MNDKRYLVRETTEADSVYYVGLFSSYSAAQEFIERFVGTIAESWKHEIVDVEKLVPGFVPVEALNASLM